MARALVIVLSAALALPAVARADVTVIYAPALQQAPLVARTVMPCEAASAPEPMAISEPATAPEPRAAEASETTFVSVPEPASAVAEDAQAPAPEPDADTAPPAASLGAQCLAPAPVLFVRANDGSGEHASLALTDCEGRPDPASLAELSLLARPRALSTRPSARELAEHATDSEWAAEGIRRLHPGLVERLRALADHFPGHAIEIISGYRPDAREGSRHLFGLAIDVRVRGASLDAVHAFVTRFERTGVGLYPTSEFIHLDVRERSARWTDEAGPGEAPRLVRAEARRRGAPVRAVEPPTASEPASVQPASTETELDADAIADEVLRGFGDLQLPPPPPPG